MVKKDNTIFINTQCDSVMLATILLCLTHSGCWYHKEKFIIYVLLYCYCVTYYDTWLRLCKWSILKIQKKWSQYYKRKSCKTILIYKSCLRQRQVKQIHNISILYRLDYHGSSLFSKPCYHFKFLLSRMLLLISDFDNITFQNIITTTIVAFRKFLLFV